MMATFVNDLRHGLRVFRRQPGLWLLATLALSAGMGVNATLLSFARALLQGRQLFDTERTVVIRAFHPGQGRSVAAAADVLALQEQSRTLADWIIHENAAATVTGAGIEPERLQFQRVNQAFLGATKAKIALGRGFTNSDFAAGQTPVVLLSSGLWKSRYGSAPDIVGRTIRLDGEDHTVVGVASDEYWFPTLETKLWVPLRDNVLKATASTSRTFRVMATLVPGATREQARQELAAISRRLEVANPVTHASWMMVPLDVEAGLFTDNDRTALFLVRMLGFGILIISCANVANLLLVQAIGRRREMAIRGALGAGTGRLIRQLAAESLWLAIPATVAGLAMASWLAEILFRVIAPLANLPLPKQMVDGPVLAFSIGTAVACLVFFSLPAAWQAGKLDLAPAMREGDLRTGAGWASRFMARGFVIAQSALALALVIASGLVASVVVELSRIDLGYPTERLVVATARPSPKRYANAGEARTFYERGLQALRGLPQVEHVGLMSTVPQFGGDGIGTVFAKEADRAKPVDQQIRGFLLPAGEGAIEALGVRRIAGRLIDARDTSDSDPVVVANETAARAIGMSNAIGERVCFVANNGCFRIVGIVGDIRRSNIARATLPAFFVPAQQFAGRDYQWLVRVRGDMAAALTAMRPRVQQIDAEEPVQWTVIDEDNYRDQTGGRLLSSIVATMGGLALFMATIGLYCLLSYQVSQQMRDWGIRLALGAPGRDIERRIVGSGLRLIAWGAIPGFALAYGVAKVLAGMMPPGMNVSPWIWAGATAAVLVTGVVAAGVPARRAARIDPATVLRND